MHYANGKEAKLGDLVVLRRAPENTYGFTEVIGTLQQGQASSSGCNGQILPLAQRSISDLGEGQWTPMFNVGLWCVTVGELMPVDIPGRPAKAPTA